MLTLEALVVYLRVQGPCTLVCHPTPCLPLRLHLLNPTSSICFDVGSPVTAKWPCAVRPGEPGAFAPELIKTSHFPSREEHTRHTRPCPRINGVSITKWQASSRTPAAGVGREHEQPSTSLWFIFCFQRACLPPRLTLPAPDSLPAQPRPITPSLCLAGPAGSRHFPQGKHICWIRPHSLASPQTDTEAS